MADTLITIDTIQIRRSSTPGFRPGMNETRGLNDGELFINDADGVLRVGGLAGLHTDFLILPDLGTAATKDVDVAGGVASFDATQRAGHTAAPDANYSALITDTQIGFANLTAPRTVTLPDVDAYPFGQVLFIADESGQCSVDRPITITIGAGTNDTIAGELTQPLTNAYQGLGLRRGAANVWIIAR